MPTYYIYYLRLPLTEHPAVPIILSNSDYNYMATNKIIKDEVKEEREDIPSPHPSPQHRNPEIHNEPPPINPREDEDNPLAWDRCAICRSRGNYRHMFHCDGCEEAFHPGCLARKSPRNHDDSRFTSFTCRSCLDQERRAKLSRHE